jgi:hypothetical protein
MPIHLRACFQRQAKHPRAFVALSFLFVFLLLFIVPAAAAQNASPVQPDQAGQPASGGLFAVFLPLIARGEAQPPGPGIAGPFYGQPVTPHVFTGDLRDLPLKAGWVAGNPLIVVPEGGNGGDTVSPPTRAAALPSLASSAPSPSQVLGAPRQSFEGIAFTGFVPPDTVGDVGPNHYIQMVNSAFAVYNKTGALLAGPVNINSLWTGFGGVCQTTNRGDPIVLYDPLADRWLLSQFAFNVDGSGNPIAPFFECVAISRTANPVSGGWNLYGFQTPAFPDYPKFGVWPEAYYMSTYEGDNLGVYALDRVNMLAGAVARPFVRFTLPSLSDGRRQTRVLPSDVDGPNAPPTSTPNLFVRSVEAALQTGANDRLEVFEFRAVFGGGGSTFGGPVVSLNTAPYDISLCGDALPRNCIPQPGTTRGLDPLSNRLMWRLQYRNFGSYETLVVNQTVDVGSERAGIRWYEMRRAGGTWSIFQQGTFAPDDGAHRWMGSAAMDGEGNIALGYSVSSSAIFPSIRYTGRKAGDPLGTLPQGEVTLMTGSGSQILNDGNGNPIFRWGDYSAMSVDPVDDCTFWYTQQYLPADGRWRTRIGTFQLCNEPPVADANGPYTTQEGADVTVNASASSDPDGDALTYAWDFDSDGVFADASGATPAFANVGRDGVFPIAVRVTDPDGLFDDDASTVTVTNLPPTLSLSSAPADEGAAISVNGVVSDPGWLDPLSATIDWGDGAPTQPISGVLENSRPNATLTFSLSHVYGDNGVFTARVCAADDDVTVCQPITLTVHNVAPTAQIDEGATLLINGLPTGFGRVGSTLTFTGRAQDPGSDDLLLLWDWDRTDTIFPDHSTLYLVNPPNPDPPLSPSLQPRNLTESQSAHLSFACHYVVTFRVTDDDGGQTTDTLDMIIVGSATRARSADYWKSKYQHASDLGMLSGNQLSYLEIVRHMSRVFDEAASTATVGDAYAILSATATARERLDRQLLAAWLNFANGAIGYTQLVDTDGDGTADTSFATVMASAEAVRLNPAATTAQLDAQAALLSHLNR